MADAVVEGNTHASSASKTVQQNPLTRKLKKILDTRLDNDKELIDALKALSVFFGENTLRARRNLRGDVERRSLEISEKFEAHFREVKETLDDIYNDIQSMNTCCQEMTERLQASKESTQDLIEKTNKLQNEQKHVELQANLVDTFLDRYQLKPHEVKALRVSKENIVTEEFFNALNRAKQIHQDCKILLRSKQQTAGLEIMESMALYQETAYEKLYRWTQDECRGMTGDTPDVSGGLCRAIEALQDRQVLLRYTLDELSSARRSAIVRCFIDALTRGGVGGTPRPIELYSHDPVRYVGDMLAWLHQAVAGEKELLHSLLRRTKVQEDKGMVVKVLNGIMEGVCTPFKVRVEQVITSENDAPLLFRLSNLLKFYGETLLTVFENESAVLVNTIGELRHLSYQMFFNSLAFHGTKLAEKADIPPPDLSPSQTVIETMQLLKDVLASHDAAITPINERQQDYEKIFSCILDPLLQCCVLTASRLNVPDMAAYIINCLYQIQVTLAVYEFTDLRLEMLAAQTDAHTDTLVNEQGSFILKRSGLGNVYTPLKENDNKGVPATSGLDFEAVKESLNLFDQYLSNPDGLHIPQLELIRSTRLRDTIRKRSRDLIDVAYQKVYTELTNENTQFANNSIINRTPEQIRQLLN